MQILFLRLLYNVTNDRWPMSPVPISLFWPQALGNIGADATLWRTAKRFFCSIFLTHKDSSQEMIVILNVPIGYSF